MVITNQGVAIQPCFYASKTYAIYKTGHWVVFIKLGQKHASRDGIELADFEAFGEVLSFGLGVVELILVPLLVELLASGLSFVHTAIYSTHNKHPIRTKILSLSSNQKHIKYRVRSIIFKWFPNGMAKTWLGKA